MFKLSRLNLILAAISALSGRPEHYPAAPCGQRRQRADVREPGLVPIGDANIRPGYRLQHSELPELLCGTRHRGRSHPRIDAPALPGQHTALWFVIPSSAPLGQAIVRLKQKPDTGDVATFPFAAGIQIVATAPGLFTKSYTGSGPVLATDGTLKAIALTNASVPGQQIAMWATGLGGARTGDVTVEIAAKSSLRRIRGSAQRPRSRPDQLHHPRRCEVRLLRSPRDPRSRRPKQHRRPQHQRQSQRLRASPGPLLFRPRRVGCGTVRHPRALPRLLHLRRPQFRGCGRKHDVRIRGSARGRLPLLRLHGQ